MKKFQIVLFKNKKKKKIIKSYSTKSNAQEKYNKLLKENVVPFEVFFENSEPCKYELAIVCEGLINPYPLFKVDELGRNEEVFLKNNDSHHIIEISDYKVEELIYDWDLNRRIDFNFFLKTYINNKELKVISTLNNKIVVQKETDFKLFSLKNGEDCERFLQVLEDYHMKKNRSDSIFVRDTSTTHRKWMYDLLEKHGFERSKLYRQKTTFSKRS